MILVLFRKLRVFQLGLHSVSPSLMNRESSEHVFIVLGRSDPLLLLLKLAVTGILEWVSGVLLR